MSSLGTRWRHGWRSRLYRSLYRDMSQIGDEALARPTLVVAPHPDDETLGCGGTILRLRQLGAEVAIVILSDGASSHRRLMDPNELARRRREEARQAAAALDVAEGKLYHFEYSDQQLGSNLMEASERLLTVVREFEPERVLLPYRHEPPDDHRAAHRIAELALSQYEQRLEIWEYPIWLWCALPFCVPPGQNRWGGLRLLMHGQVTSSMFRRHFRLGVNIEPFLERKQTALAAHRSQMEPLGGDPRWKTLAEVAGGEWLERFFDRYELFYHYTMEPNKPL